ncbi:hypothetical protein [Paraburkholderia sp. J10-1]|uniref:hypothetical protein n=1 Tax=Paraburkholderia sp. J10-1 TaxID=2805430 RepID=UPI002AB67B7E|nr:hypothetical protein [Paraburkholderia sp. J10-1]
MSAQTTGNQSIPTPCKLCGGVLYLHVDLCPYCGTDRPLDAAAPARPKATLAVVGSAAAPLRAVAQVSLAGAATSNRPSVQADYLHNYQLEEQRPFWHTGKGRFANGVLLAWLIVAIAYAAFLLYGARHRQEREVRATRASVAEQSSPNANAALARDANTEDAHEILRGGAPAQQRRDNALQNADRCAEQRAWDCVREQASEALAIDPGSLHARSLMERAILAAGWSPLRSPNSTTAQAEASVPLPRGAATVPLPSSHDWGAARPAVPKNEPTTIASPPPLPDATSTTTNGNPPDVSSASASVATTAASDSATADAVGADSSDSGVDAQQRAILELGWKHASSTEAAH